MAEVVLDKVNKEYENGFHAVQDLDLDIADGELRIGGRVVNQLAPRDRDIASSRAASASGSPWAGPSSASPRSS